jgi:hypothetical protein
MLDRLKAHLIALARQGKTCTYAELAGHLGVAPPKVIHQTTQLLEALMEDQARAGEPQLASFVVSRARGGLPAPGFFMLLVELGRYAGPASGTAAAAFIETERERCAQYFVN